MCLPVSSHDDDEFDVSLSCSVKRKIIITMTNTIRRPFHISLEYSSALRISLRKYYF